MRRLALAALLVGAAPALADNTPVERALGGVEWSGGPSSLRLLGNHSDQQLVDLLRDPTTTPLRRRRAIMLSQYADTPVVRAFLLERFAQLRGATEGSEALELAALLPVAARFGLVEWSAIQLLLDHPVATLRESVAVALFALDPARARVVLRIKLLHERDVGVRSRLQRLIASR